MISPSAITFKFAFKLCFECTNNIDEYESFILGLRIAYKYQIIYLCVKGYYKLVVKQIRQLYATNNGRLKHYRNVSWELIEFFKSFNIVYHERSLNEVPDQLAKVAVNHELSPQNPHCQYEIEIMARP